MTETEPDRCVSLTAYGTRCKKRASEGSEFCALHRKADYSLLTDEVAAQIIAMLRAGNHVRTAVKAVGISRPTFGVWMRRGARGEQPYSDFRDRVDQARAEAEARHVTQVAAAASQDWRAATWMLDRQLEGSPDERPDTDELAARVEAEAIAEARATLDAIGEDPELSAGAIGRYAAAMVVWKLLEADWERLGRPGTALGGATGFGTVVHPLIPQIASARRDVSQLGAALGLDPNGRQRLSRQVGAGRPPGAASAPDRAAPPRRRLRAV